MNRKTLALVVPSLTYATFCLLASKFQSKVLLQPHHLADSHTFTFEHNIPFEEFYFENPHTDMKINALYFKTPKVPSDGLVFYLHGNATNLQRYGTYAIDFVDKGYDVLMIDYRGFGKSKGKITEEAIIHRDVQYIYEQILATYPYSEDQIVLYGRSLGTGIATKLASSIHNNPKALMLEMPYFNIADVAKYYFPILPYEKLFKFTFRTDLWIQQVDCPIYIFHGTRDWIVPYSSSQKFRPYLKEKDCFVTIKGGRHKNLRTFPLYHQQLLHFLQGEPQ